MRKKKFVVNFRLKAPYHKMKVSIKELKRIMKCVNKYKLSEDDLVERFQLKEGNVENRRKSIEVFWDIEKGRYKYALMFSATEVIFSPKFLAGLKIERDQAKMDKVIDQLSHLSASFQKYIEVKWEADDMPI
jgi:hypothetical protein